MNELSTVIKTVNSCRRKLKLRRLEYTCQEKTQISIASGENEKFSEKKQAKTLKGAATHEEVRKNECPTPKDGVALEKSEVAKAGDQYTCISYGSVSVIGGRREMEDAVSVELGFASKGEDKYDFFGVYDGHGGSTVAEKCKERLYRVLEEMLVGKEKLEWERVMVESFKRMDEEVLKERMMGSTAVVAIVGKDEVVVANCGDSRAVLSREGVAVPLSVDHKPDRPDELERVEAAGGRVINWNGNRVSGVLATSRSIGDQYLKPFVISEPEVTVSKRSDKDEFLILASDGLWDMISNEFACKVVRRCLSGRMRRKSQEVLRESRAAEAAIVLAELAMARGSRDNISVIVVDLKTPN